MKVCEGRPLSHRTLHGECGGRTRRGWNLTLSLICILLGYLEVTNCNTQSDNQMASHSFVSPDAALHAWALLPSIGRKALAMLAQPSEFWIIQEAQETFCWPLHLSRWRELVLQLTGAITTRQLWVQASEGMLWVPPLRLAWCGFSIPPSSS